ncbi:hypothetical protein NJH77_26000 [Serratia fonticola]|uniref:hypothetical protein n=1 Tax=Serratia fonticola TaxID=47917 RepID=UPI002096AB93|nr:hypothetical protein [Serratia fonticola]MCO7512699.1 hypothetical protein [Serratia fonticola]
MSESSENKIIDLYAEVAALKSLVTQLLLDKSSEDIQRYVKDVSLLPVLNLPSPTPDEAHIVQIKAQKIARAVVVAIRESRK